MKQKYNAKWRGKIFLALTVLLAPIAVHGAPDRFVDSDDYKSKEFKKCVIADYTDLAKGDDIGWLWVMPGAKLADYNIKIGKFENITDELRNSQLEEIKKLYADIFSPKKDRKGVLTADFCVYEVQKFSAAKAWIPFAGGHQMQAGAGLELTLQDRGKTVAKFRHFAREGSSIEDAAQEVAEDLKKYINKH